MKPTNAITRRLNNAERQIHGSEKTEYRVDCRIVDVYDRERVLDGAAKEIALKIGKDPGVLYGKVEVEGRTIYAAFAMPAEQLLSQYGNWYAIVGLPARLWYRSSGQPVIEIRAATDRYLTNLVEDSTTYDIGAIL